MKAYTFVTGEIVGALEASKAMHTAALSANSDRRVMLLTTFSAAVSCLYAGKVDIPCKAEKKRFLERINQLQIALLSAARGMSAVEELQVQFFCAQLAGTGKKRVMMMHPHRRQQAK